MKYFLLLLLLIIPLAYAQTDLSISKSSYAQKEIFQAEIFMGNIKSTDVSILNPTGYKSNIGINLIKITDNHYFVFFNIPETIPGDYTLKVKESKKSFQVNPAKDKLSVSQGAIVFRKEDSPIFKITVTNNDIISQTVEIFSSNPSLTPSVSSLVLSGRTSKDFNIRLDKQTFSFLSTVSINNYEIPVWSITDSKIIPFYTVQEPPKSRGLEFYIKDIKITSINKEIQASIPIVDSIYFKNILNESINDIKISLTGNLPDIVNIDFTKLEALAPDEQKKLDIVINEERSPIEEYYSGNLVIYSDKYSFKLPMNFKVVEIAEKPKIITEEDITEQLEEITEPEEKLQIKYIYLLILIVIILIFIYLSLKKPKAKKQTFKQFIKKFKP